MANRPQYRMTRQRALILKTLRESNAHLSADEIHLRVRRVLPKISLGTVYRNLELLYELKEINKLELGGGQNRWDGEIGRHYHIRCAVCAKVENVDYRPGDDMEAMVRRVNRFSGDRSPSGVCGDVPGMPGTYGFTRIKKDRSGREGMIFKPLFPYQRESQRILS